jgi:hypothetical protein
MSQNEFSVVLHLHEFGDIFIFIFDIHIFLVKNHVWGKNWDMKLIKL